MGLFSSSTKTYVDSSVWNMAGEYDTRFKVLPNIVAGAIFGKQEWDLGNRIKMGLMNSSAVSQRRFFRWAKTNYALGMPAAQVSVEVRVRADAISAELESILALGEDQILQVNVAVIDQADDDYWAEEYVAENRPAALDGTWIPYFDPITNTFKIVFGENDEETFPAPADFLWGIQDSARRLLYVNYQILLRDPESRIVSVSEAQMFTYRIGSGNAVFDALDTSAGSTMSEFYPAIPIRINNKSVTENTHFENIAKGYKKLSGGGDIGQILEMIEEHESVGDMDYVYVVFGVSLNTEDQSGRSYIYRFFKELLNQQQVSETANEVSAFALQNEIASNSFMEWAVGNSIYTHPLFGSPAPPGGGSFQPSLNEIKIKMPSFGNFNMSMRWREISETQHLGNAGIIETDGEALKRGQYAVFTRESNVHTLVGSTLFNQVEQANDFVIVKQISETRYSKLTVAGMSHSNYVYGGKSVRIVPQNALASEDESGFLIPLHQPTMNSLSLSKRAQLSSCNTYMVINSYQNVTTKWYQKGFFKIVLVIASVVLAVYTGGGSLAATAGILGTNAAVGLAVGATAATAAIVGAAVNAIAAVILSKLITVASTAIFGDKVGQIVAVIATTVAMAYGSAYASTGSFSVDWSAMMQVDNLMKLTSAIGQGYQNIMNMETQELMDEVEAAAADFEEQSEKIEELSRDVLGMTSSGIDSMILMNADEYFVESRGSFMGRTLMTGNDIIELSIAMIENFADISLDLPLAPT